MRLDHLAAILLVLIHYGIAVSHLWHSTATWQQIGTRFLKTLPVLMGLVLLSAFTGFAIGGKVGMLGNSLGSIVWMGWLFVMLASRTDAPR